VKKRSNLSPVPGSLTYRSPPCATADDPGRELARFIVNTRYRDIPAAGVGYMKQVVLDQLGVIIGGSRYAEAAVALDLVKGWGGRRESAIILFGGRAPAPNAAFTMGTMAGALDFGDTHPEAAHIIQIVLPALLGALGLKSRVTGEEFVTALVVGAEVGARLGDATFAATSAASNPTASELYIKRAPDPMNYIAAAAAIARLLGLNEEQTYQALSIQQSAFRGATMAMCGNSTLAFLRGFAAWHAVNAVLLAQRGMTGPPNAFGGPTGFLAETYPWKNDVSLLTDGLGEKWSWAATRIKPFPGCYGTMCPDTAMYTIRRKAAFDPRKIAKIEVSQSESIYEFVSKLESSVNPRNEAEAQFSLPYTVCTIAIDGNITLDAFTPAAVARADVRALMTRVTAKVDESLPLASAMVRVALDDGTVYTERADYPRGDPVHNPMTWNEVVEKFRSCVGIAARPVPPENIERAVRMVQNLEKYKNVGRLVELLTPAKAKK
jgi:2-methylcitrate dehydratase PrpD